MQTTAKTSLAEALKEQNKVSADIIRFEEIIRGNPNSTMLSLWRTRLRELRQEKATIFNSIHSFFNA